MKAITLDIPVTDAELERYGEERLKDLFYNILERYAHEEWFDPDIIESKDYE